MTVERVVWNIQSSRIDHRCRQFGSKKVHRLLKQIRLCLQSEEFLQKYDLFFSLKLTINVRVDRTNFRKT